MPRRASVYNGEVLGFKVCRLFHGETQVLSIDFSSYEDAERYAEDSNELTSVHSIYFPVKLTSMKNAAIPEKSLD